MIEFVHLSRLRLQILLPPQHVPQFSTIALTFVQEALAAHGVLFQLRFALVYFPLRCHVPRFDGKVLPLLCLTCCFPLDDLDDQFVSALLVRLSLLFEAVILFL